MGNPMTLQVRGGREHRLGDRLFWDPGLDRAVAAGEADAKDFGRRMLGIGADANTRFPLPQLGGAAALDVPVKRVIFGCGWQIRQDRRSIRYGQRSSHRPWT
jgi:hypothetical protein